MHSCLRIFLAGRSVTRFMLGLPISRSVCSEAGHAAAAAASPRRLQPSRLPTHAATGHLHNRRLLSTFTAAAYQDSNISVQAASQPASSSTAAAPASNGAVKKRPPLPARRRTSSNQAQQDAATAAAAAPQLGSYSSSGSNGLGNDVLQQQPSEEVLHTQQRVQQQQHSQQPLQQQPPLQQQQVPEQQLQVPQQGFQQQAQLQQQQLYGQQPQLHQPPYQQEYQQQQQQQQQQQEGAAASLQFVKPGRPRPRRSRTTSAGDTQASSSASPPARPAVGQLGSTQQESPAAGTAVGQAAFNSTLQQLPTTQQQQAPTPAAAAAPTPAVEAISTEFDSAVRNKFSSRPQSALQPPSQPPSAAAAAWCRALGIDAGVLQQWGAGMATVPHPETKQPVEVLALPYYRRGVLLDMRCLLLQQGRLAGSWLAVGARELYMQRELQDASSVVFVSCELDALLLSAAGCPAIALTQQTPLWLDTASTQQQQQQLWVPPLQQVLQLRQRQQMAHLQQQQQQHVPEDPRLRLSSLAAELDKLRRQYESGAVRKQGSSSNRSGFEPEGLLVSDVAQPAPSGLSLLLPSASTAVIAMPQGAERHCSSLVASHLAGLLGEVHCRHMQWPDAYPADVAAAAASAVASSVSEQQDQQQQQQLTQQQQDQQPQLSPQQLQQQQQLLELQAALLADVTAAPGQGSGWDVVLLSALAGSEGVAEAVDGAYVWPIMGLERFSDYTFDLLTYYQTPNMDQIALSTGWPSLDEYYKVAPGEVTLVTGVPNSGKSEWLDALAVNVALQHGWRFAVCSMEKRPRDHARQLLEKIARRPLLSAGYAGEVPRMTLQELDVAYQALSDHFFVIASGEDSMPSMAWVLEKAKAAKIQFGINGLIIDPYNELDPTRTANMMEHEHVNEIMGQLRRFARENNVHCWLVAHPRQMGSMWRGERPGLQDVSGGANFMNKTDNGIIVHRNWSKLKELQDRAAGDKAGGSSSKRRPALPGSGAAATPAEGEQAGDEQQQQALQNAEFEVQVIMEKVRNKTTGSRGQCVLVYDRVTGRYHEQGEDPDRRGLLDDVPVWTDSPGSLEVSDLPVDGAGQPAEVQSIYGAELYQGYMQQEGVVQEQALEQAAEDRHFYSTS